VKFLAGHGGRVHLLLMEVVMPEIGGKDMAKRPGSPALASKVRESLKERESGDEKSD